MSRLIEELQGNLHQVVEGCTETERRVEALERNALHGKGSGKGMGQHARQNKERTLLDPKYMQMRHLTEKICTARGLFVKWRRNLDTYFDAFPQGSGSTWTSSRR